MKNNLKKIALALFVVGAFIVYAVFGQRNSASNSNTVNNSVGADSNSKTTYKDGEYTGAAFDALYGQLQVKAVISNGKISDIVFINDTGNGGRQLRGLSQLRSEALSAQSAQVDTVSGATNSSGAFVSSLSSALAQATK
jgi:uncharacterized protein with FMN-binding domain